MTKSKEEIIQWLSKLDEDYLLSIHKQYYKRVLEKEQQKELKKKVVIDKTTPKYKLALQLVNKILINIAQSQIDDLTDFRDIDREDIIKDVNNEALKSMQTELFKVFDKQKCGFYRKGDCMVLNWLRGICKDLGLAFVNRKVTKVVHSKIYSHYLYSIKLKNI